MTTLTLPTSQERMNVVIAGHVDHGKSTVIGRLLADTGSLPEGKLEAVRAMCERNARPFEYAFLLDALKNEQAQGITIDTARCFFKTARRHYIIHDAPGHIEFMKNMVTGAARAQAALLVIDSDEGIQENSKRHGYMISMLGISQLAVLVNKMDLVDYSQQVFEHIREQYSRFLEHLGVRPQAFIPIAAREGVNMTTRSPQTAWYDGPTVLEQIDAFEPPAGAQGLPFRMPVQDIYKFTAQGDDRRIVAGTVESGTIAAGARVVFYPSGKESVIKNIETFNAPTPQQAEPGQAAGFTLTTQIYIKPGELMVRADQPAPRVHTRLRANIFWMGRPPMIPGKRYKLKLGAARVAVELAQVSNVLDASQLQSVQGKQQIDRHDVAECVLQTVRPVAFDLRGDIEATGRFVIVDEHEIAGAGVVLEALGEQTGGQTQDDVSGRNEWEKGEITPVQRAARNGHTGKFILVLGAEGSGKRQLARRIEAELFARGAQTYYLGIGNVLGDLDRSERIRPVERDGQIEQLGELGRLMTDAGLLLFTTAADLDDYDLERLRQINAPAELFVVTLGECGLASFEPDVVLPASPKPAQAVAQIVAALGRNRVLHDFEI